MDIYRAFHDWRVRLMDAIAMRKIHSDFLRTLRSDMQIVIDLIDKELARRESTEGK